MKNTFKLLSLITACSLMHAEGLLPPPSGDLADKNNVEISGAITDINSLNASGAININKSSSIKLLENKNTQNIMIKSPFDVNSTFTTDSRGGVNNKLYFSRQITVNAGGNYIDYGSKFIGEGGNFFDGHSSFIQDNNPAIQINGGKATLYGSHLESGQMEPGGYGGYKAAATVLLSKGELDIVGSTIIRHKQGNSYAEAIKVKAMNKDTASVSITGSNIISDKGASSISANRDVTIDDTLWDNKLGGANIALKKQGTHLLGGVELAVDKNAGVAEPKFTFKGILKDSITSFVAKENHTLLTTYSKDPMISNTTPFESFIHGNNSLDGVVEIDKVYILGGISFHARQDRQKLSLSLKNSFITDSIKSGFDLVNDETRYASNFIFDNVLAGGAISNYLGDINSTNSYFAKSLSVLNKTNFLKDNGSVFMGGVSANNMDFTNSELKGGDYGVANGTTTDKATKISLSNAKAYDKANIFTNELGLNSSIINSSLNINSITSTSSNINTKLGSSLNSVNLSGGSVMGGFKTQNLNASNTVFFLGGTKATYDGMIISTNQTLGSNNTLGILGVVTKDSSGKLITNAINDNLPLAVLRGGNDFFKQAKFYHGITELTPANANLVYEKVKDKNGYEYLAYVLVKDSDKDKNLKDIAFDGGNFSVESAINGSLVSANGSLINENIIKELNGKNSSVSFTPDDIGNLTPPNITPPPSGGGSNGGENGSGGNNGSNSNGETTAPPDNGNNGSGGNENGGGSNSGDGGNVTPPDSGDSSNGGGGNNGGETTTPPNPPTPVKPSVKEELELMITGQNEVALNEAKVMANQFYYSHIFEYNNLNKRMGELRRLNGKNGGIWSRGYFTKASIYDTKLTSNAMQIGADKLSGTNFGYLYAGFLLNMGKTKSNTNSSIDNYGGGFYASFIGHNGFFTDFTIKLNHYKSHFKNDTFLGELESSGTGYIASFEIGNRFGNEYYLEPSIEFIASYTPKTDISNQNISIKSKENLMQVLKTSLNGGVRFDGFDLRFGVGGVFDLNKPSEFMIDDGLSSYVFDREKKDKRGFATFGLNTNLSKNTMFSIELEKGFGGIMKLDYDANATIRYEF